MDHEPKSSVAQIMNRFFFLSKKHIEICDDSMFRTHDTPNEDNGQTEEIQLSGNMLPPKHVRPRKPLLSKPIHIA